jgi:uncharacterized UPF0160 family protein
MRCLEYFMMNLNNTNEKVTLVTHSGSFHSDDIFACATLSILLERKGIEFDVLRTRDEEIINRGNYVFDVGCIYDAEHDRFDHHQPGGAGKHDNGIEYAAFGLVWKKYGEELCGSKEAALMIDTKLVSPIDAGDNAINLTEPKNVVSPYYIQNAFNSFYPTWKNLGDDALYAGFIECVGMAKKILEREIAQATDMMDAKDAVLEIYHNTSDKKIVVLDKKYPYEEFLSQFPEPMFVIYPRVDGAWAAKAQREDKRSFKNKKDFPASWSGLRDEELQKVSGVADALFCHRALFLAVARSKEGAIKLAQIALDL